MFDPGKETEIVVNGKTWIVGRLTVEVVLGFRDWVRAKEPNPFAWLDKYIDKLPADKALPLLKEAKAVQDQLDCFSMQTDLAQKWIETEEGVAEMVRLLLHPRHPNVTREEAFAIVMEFGKDKISAAIDKAQGQLPSEKNSSPRRPVVAQAG